MAVGPAGAPDWSRAPEVTGFRLLKGGRLASAQSHAQVCYDARNLYVRFRCPAPDPATLTGEVRERDGAVWQDDAVELFLDPGKTGAHSYQFIANCKGSQYDGRDGESGWNGEWAASAAVDPEAREWVCALTIPFATLDRGAPAPEAQWGVNFCADSAAAGENSAWADVPGKYDQPALFGLLRFAPGAPAVQLLNLGNLGTGSGQLGLSFYAQTTQTVNVAARLAGTERTLLDDTRAVPLQAEAKETVRLEFKAEPAGEYLADLTVHSGDGRLLFAAHSPVAVLPNVQLTTRSFPTAGRVEVSVDASVLPQAAGELRAVVTASGGAGKELARQQIAALKAGRGTAELGLGTATGAITLTAQVLDPTGTVLGSAETLVERPPAPAWAKTRAGLTDKVLRPFEPLRFGKDVARIWGRTLTYGKRLLPASITSRDKELLAAPVRFRLRSGDKQQTVELPGTTKSASALALVREGQTTVRGLRLRGRQTLEYDGCLKLELDVSSAGAVPIQELSFEIPLRPEVARYLHTCRADWATSRSQAIPPEGWKSKFMPFLWVGDEDRGLAWFSETDEPFRVADPNAVIEIVPAGTQTILRVHVIDTPTELRQPFKLVFGLQPTPVKPVPPRKARLWHGVHFGMENETASGEGCLKLPAAGNLDLRRGTLELVATLDFDPEEVARTKHNHTLFHLAQANGDQVYVFWDHPARSLWFYLGLGETYPQKYPIHLTTQNLGWKKGETHHIAVTWGERTTLYLDGKAAGAAGPYDGWMSGPLTTESVAFGSDLGHEQTEWIINAVQITSQPLEADALASSAARVAQQGPQARLTATPDTLVLYHPRAAADSRTLPPVQTPDRLAAGAPQLVGGAVARADGVHCSVGQEQTVLDVLKAAGVEVVVYHHTWTDHYGYPATTHGDELESLAKACHGRGLKLLLYFGYGLGNRTPEMQVYHDEWTVQPLIFWGTGYPPEQQFDAACNRSLEPEFLLDGISKLLDQYALNGVYLDGTTEAFGCVNHYHGCGYQQDGAWKPTYPIWRTREFMRRLAGLFQAKRKDYLIDVHMSANLTIPTLAFCDSYWDGEQFEMYVHGQKDPRALLPLNTFRAEFMGRQWGLDPEFLVYDGRPFTRDEALAVTLLHDVLTRPTGIADALSAAAALWKARDDFGVERAEFLPYWNNGNVFTPAPAGVYVSAYRRPETGLLLVVSNLAKEPAAATITLSAAALKGLSGAPTAVDALTGERLQIQPKQAAGGREWVLSTPLDPLRWRLVTVSAREH